jgi:hypothetical protein
MAFIRTIKRENPFAQIDKYVIEDDSISWKAKGLMAYLLSRPDDWKIRHTDLTKRAKDGKDAVTSGLQELVKAGYVFYDQERLDNGKFGEWFYEVYERPQFNPHWMADLSYAENSDAVKSDADKPSTEKADYTNNDFKDIDFINIELTNSDDDEKPFNGVNHMYFRQLVKEFNDSHPNYYDLDMWNRIYQQMVVNEIDLITYKEAVRQSRYMKGLLDKGKHIGDYATYFVIGIKRNRTSRAMAIAKKKIDDAQKMIKPKEAPSAPVPFYNWLEN